jgi:hypothetical protein
VFGEDKEARKERENMFLCVFGALEKNLSVCLLWRHLFQITEKHWKEKKKKEKRNEK